MKISDVISMCIANLTRRKVRTLLTVIGVVVGTCAIMVMVSLGLGMQASQDAMLAQMGDLTVIQVYNYNNTSEEIVLDDDAVAAMSALDGVDVATPFWQPWEVSTEVVSGNNDRYQMSYPTIVGVYPEALEKFGYELNEGRFATQNDKAYTVVFGQNAAYNFRDTKRKRNNWVWAEPDPVTGKITPPFVDIWKDDLTLRTIKTEEDSKVVSYEMRVVGTIKQDWSKGWETDGGIFMDINDLKALVKEYNDINDVRSSNGQAGYSDVRVRVKDLDLVAGVEDQIQAMGFETYSMESMREPMQEQSRQQQLILGGLGFISLFVAAIGITNTMIMSIYERTREIGVMKVLGCRLGNIRAVFLMEAGCIGFIGGVIGVLISCGISWVLNHLSGGGLASGLMGLLGGGYYYGGSDVGISIIPAWLIAASLVFSTMVGLVSGFGPANRAVKISALEAIKHE
ncbi:MAG: ABC transporter permease [Oscillospiraceae bacterium]|nr:ABC transporter permease [Oscillospiraceae bacterium]